MLAAISRATSRTQSWRLAQRLYRLVLLSLPKTTPVAGFTMWVRLHAVQMMGS
jgi:hypothetical protein